jgi:tetratricopeptide (TPR) repeat protein
MLKSKNRLRDLRLWKIFSLKRLDPKTRMRPPNCQNLLTCKNNLFSGGQEEYPDIGTSDFIVQPLRESGGINKKVIRGLIFFLIVVPFLSATAVPQLHAFQNRVDTPGTQADPTEPRKQTNPTSHKEPRQSAQAKEPKDYTSEGYSHLLSGKIDEAMAELNQALAHDPKDGFAHLLLGYCYLRKENTNAAEKELHLALTLGEKDPRVYSFLGQLYEAQGEYEKAAQSFAMVIKLAPKEPEAYLRLARILSLHTTDLTSAKNLAETCLSLKPSDELRVQAYLVLAGIANTKEEREAYVKHVLEIDPSNAMAKTLLRFGEMGEEYHANVKISDEARQHFDKAENYFSKNQFQEAIVEYKAAIAIEPKFAKAYLYLGDCFYRIGQYEEASVHFKRATEIDPSNPQAWAFLGDAYYKLENLKQACSCLKEAVRLDPNYYNAAQKFRQICQGP